ncbi:low-density lipoprotein receptor-related protein 4-like [Crassostrea angulata]|uniref:low-density lipoprotein receptor-related protein 4-like n=1 Tax=Magallana angulata TaxID=2784310 RepID=UPI0022B0F4FE|nr:low-density lipoprotein receptor-related protein 4-like [Crassostrea angulata]
MKLHVIFIEKHSFVIVPLICVLSFLDFSNAQDTIDNGLIISQLPNLYSSGSLTTLPGSIDAFKTASIFPVRNFNFHETTEIISIATDANDRKIYLLDGNTRSLYKMNNFNVWLNDSSQSITLLHEGISKTSTKLAYDWLTKNIYWTDEYYNWIAVQSTNDSDPSMFRVLVENGLSKPLAIAVDPLVGYLFWSEHDKTGKIERATLAGEERETIVTGAVWIPDMAVDTESKTIYWIDIKRNTVEKCDYDGNNRHVVRRSKFTSITMSGITVYKDLVCVTEYHSYLVTCLDKTTGDNKWMRYFRSRTPWAISVYDKTTQKIIDHSCNSLKCQHFCVNTPSGGKCMCKSGYKLASDKVTCQEEHYLFSKGLFIANKTDICMLDIRVITSLSHEPICLPLNRESVKLLATSAVDKRLYYTDSGFLYSYDFLSNKSSSLTRVGKISGLTFDWIENIVYWSDSKSISLYSVGSGIVNKVIDNVENPSYLTVCPYHKRLYWITSSTAGDRIVYASLDGSNITTVYTSVTKSGLSGLYYNVDTSRIFWIDNGEVKSVKNDGSDLQTYFTVNHDKELLVYKDYTLSTTTENELHSASLASRRIELTVELDGFGKLTGMAIFDPGLQKKQKGPCELNNGGCEHICLPKGTFRKCMCGFGYRLEVNGVNCSSDTMKNNFILTVDFTHKRMYQISTQSAVVSAVDVDKDYSPARAFVHHVTSEIYWSDYRNRQIKKMDLSGKNVTTILNLGSFTPFGIAIDYSTDLLYYAAVLSGLTSASFIGVVDPYTGYDRQIITDLAAAYEVVLYPSKGYLFYTDTGDAPYIGRSSMDGTFKEAIVATKIRQVNGLAIDYTSKRLYWSDGVQDVIEYCDFDGKNRHVLLKDEQAHIANLVVAGNFVYYTAINRQRVTKVNKNSGYKVHWMMDSHEYGRLESVDTHPGDVQPVNTDCLNKNGNCSSMCIPTLTGYICACADGMDMKDKFTCTQGDKRKPLTILRGLSYREEEVVSENNIPVQNLGGPRAVKAEDTSDATPVIAGSVLGAVVLIGIVVVLLFIYFKRRARIAYEEQIDTPNVKFANDSGISNAGFGDGNPEIRINS